MPIHIRDARDWRHAPLEQLRIDSLLRLTGTGAAALDVGARDGYVSRKLADTFSTVTALDLQQPEIAHPRITPIAGDVTSLPFADQSFDCVLCAEVLEHIPTHLLPKACSELMRVTRSRLVIGVPYREDRRCGQTTCTACGQVNPPWGHVNSFHEKRLQSLFHGLAWHAVDFVGGNRRRTNALSAALMRFAGNPFGSYEQDEPCIHCGRDLVAPSSRSLPQRVATRLAALLTSAQQALTPTRPNWIHVQLSRPAS